MADQLKSNRVTNATTARDQLPARIAEIERALSFLLGVPLDTLINNPLALATAAGLHSLYLQDAGGDPVVTGQLLRHSNLLRIHNGSRPVTLAYQDDLLIGGDAGEPVVSADGVEGALCAAVTVLGGTLGVGGAIHGTFEFIITAMQAAATLTVKLGIAGQFFMVETITNGTGGLIQGLTGRVDFRIRGRNSTGIQGGGYTISIDPIADTLNLGAPLIYTKSHVNGGIAYDSTQDAGIQVNGIWAGAGNSVSGFGLDVWKTKV